MENEKTILIVDDSNTNIVLLEAVLGTKGFRTFSARNVKEAKKVLSKNHIDLILLDLLMPDISGYDFLEEAEGTGLLNDIPVIAVSALTDDFNVEKTLKLGAIEFIKKPVNINDLVDKVVSTLSSESV